MCFISQERQKQDLQKNYLFDTNVPIRVIFAGPALSGKTTLVQSIRRHASKQKGIWASLVSSKEPSIEPKGKNTQIAEDFKDRTIGAEFHLLKVAKDLYLNIQDLAGQEGFYALHSSLLHHDESIFFVIFNLENSNKQLQQEITNQLKIIVSHCSYSTEKSIIFLGTHLDQVPNASTKMEQTKHLLNDLEEIFSINNSVKLFVNAKNPSYEEMANILKSTRELASRIRTSLVSAEL